MATYSNRIKELRTMRDMSQQALGDLLGVNFTTNGEVFILLGFFKNLSLICILQSDFS